MSYSTIIETIKVTTNDGRTATFDVCAEPGRPQRVFVHGSSAYYDIDTFNAGLKKAAKVERTQVADLFSTEPSMVRVLNTRRGD